MIDLTQARVRNMILTATWYCDVPKECRWYIENAIYYNLYVNKDTQHFTVKTTFYNFVMVVTGNVLTQFIKNNKIHRHISL